jgi:hypothetical protein
MSVDKENLKFYSIRKLISWRKSLKDDDPPKENIPNIENKTEDEFTQVFQIS